MARVTPEAEYTGERDPFWGPAPSHNGREVTEVSHRAVTNGKYKPLPTPAGSKSPAKGKTK